MSEELDVGFLDVQAWKTRPEEREANCERHQFQFQLIRFNFFYTVHLCSKGEHFFCFFLAGDQVILLDDAAYVKGSVCNIWPAYLEKKKIHS